MVCTFSMNTFMAVHQATMKLVQPVGSAVLLIAVAAIGLGPAAEAHTDHHRHHHGNKKQKAYNKGYRQGYRRAMQNNRRPHYRPYYRTYTPVYGPMVSPLHQHQRVIVAPAPWMVPVHPLQRGNRVNVGIGYNL